jgi:hypothetical protein
MAISSCAEAVEVVAIGAGGGSGVAVGLVNTTESIVRREVALFDDRGETALVTDVDRGC